uniref:AlNc14C153G7589 protein n=1 Tax=Albugo laibachii Nc14 TaxID=890382 RepID=F0WM85_9STRA|nr:AlNc14C153G7589 [Albugo laibachii Nc14]|eukprot:CCA22414.1 AlNc14C153G7589 [Albugo laibachii Nc14]
MKTSDWISYLALALQSFHTITNAQAPITNDQDTDKVCLDTHNTVRRETGTYELTWNLNLLDKSKRIVASQAQLTDFDKKRCAVLTSESWTTILTKYNSDVLEIKKLSPDWTYTTAVSNQFEATTMAIWSTHKEVGCAVGGTQRVCCYDTIGNTLNEKIIMDSVNASSVINGVLAAIPEPIKAIKNLDDKVTAAHGAIVAGLQDQATTKTNELVAMINPFGKR